jgi:hypothetical protein
MLSKAVEAKNQRGTVASARRAGSKRSTGTLLTLTAMTMLLIWRYASGVELQRPWIRGLRIFGGFSDSFECFYWFLQFFQLGSMRLISKFSAFSGPGLSFPASVIVQHRQEQPVRP